jgi:hypothetical protein
VQPRRHGRLTAERLSSSERAQQGVLECVGRVVGVSERSHRHCPQPVAVPGDQYGECVGVTIDVTRKKRSVVRAGILGRSRR